MIPNDALTNALRSLGFVFKRQTERVKLWKRRGSTSRVTVRANSSHDEDYARAILRQAGMPTEAIERFIAEAKQ